MPQMKTRAPRSCCRCSMTAKACWAALTVANHVMNVTAFGIIIWQLVKEMGSVGYLVGFLLALPVFIIGLEVLPKTLFRRYPFRALRRLLPLLRFAAFFRRPFNAAMNSLPATLHDEAPENGGTSRDELKRLLSTMAAGKLLPEPAAHLMQRVLTYRRHTALSVMVPLAQVVAVSPDTPAGVAAQIACQNGFSALPVLGEQGGYIGVFYATTLPPRLPEDRRGAPAHAPAGGSGRRSKRAQCAAASAPARCQPRSGEGPPAPACWTRDRGRFDQAPRQLIPGRASTRHHQTPAQEICCLLFSAILIDHVPIFIIPIHHAYETQQFLPPCRHHRCRVDAASLRAGRHRHHEGWQKV